MSTQHDYHVTVSIDGRPLGAFDARSGGETESDVSARWTGEGRKLYPARASISDITVKRVFERERDYEVVRALKNRAGRAPMTVSEQPLDQDGNAWGKPTTWTGILSGINDGEFDADSEDPRDLELTMAVKDCS